MFAGLTCPKTTEAAQDYLLFNIAMRKGSRQIGVEDKTAGPRLRRMLYSILTVLNGTDARGILRQIEGINSEEELARFQQDKLQTLLLHAYNNVAYYHTIFSRSNIIRNGAVDLRAFSDLPLLTKDIIRKYSGELVSRDYRKRRWRYESSGGSTGEPVRLMQDSGYRRWANANYYYWYKIILGIDEISAKKLILWGSLRDLFHGESYKVRLANWCKNTIFINTFKMTEDDMEHHIEVINSYKPDLVRGYASSLYQLCRYAQSKGLRLHSPKTLVSSAEVLSNVMRNTIEEVFGSRVFDFYGSREISSLAGECAEGLLHILAFHNHIEILDQSNHSVKEGEEGRVVVTNLHNYAMPLIRYVIGDVATLGPRKCRCGNVLPTLGGINGRIVDYLVREDGSRISPHVFTLGLCFGWVKEFQVVQFDYRHVKIVVVPKGTVKERDVSEMEKKVRLLFGEGCIVEWEFVSEIPRTPQGKYRYVQSLVQDIEVVPEIWTDR